jgi:uncharacterized protein (DUF433 family)
MSELSAFSAEQASYLSGLSVRQIYHLDNAGVLTPTYVDENRRRPFSRIYSFRDIVALRTIAILRKNYGISMQQLRELGKWMARNYETPWASLRFYVAGRMLIFQEPDTRALISAKPLGQQVMPFAIEEVVRDVSTRAKRLRQRDQAEIGRIERRRSVAQNAYVVAGTRIPTAVIYEFHEAGYDTEGIIREYPRLNPADVEAAIAHEEGLRRNRAG